MGGSASSSPVVQKSLANFMDAMSGGLNSQPALDQYSKQFRNMPDAAIRGVGDAVASIPDMAIAAGKLAMEGGFNPRMGQSERVKRFADTTYMPINPMMQDALTRAGVAETEGGNNLTRFVSGAMAPYAMGKYAGAVGDAVGAAERGAASRLRDAAMGPGDRYIYHTSPEKISAINSSGLFDDGLYFSNKPYFMTAVKNPTTYKMKINDADYISAQQIAYHDDYSKIDNVVKEIANRYDVSDDVALDLISENKSVYNIDGIKNYGDAAWDIQKAGLNAAKRLGYKGLIGNDEQGATYLTSMLGREKDLVDVAAERGALSNAERGMVKLTDDLPMDEALRIKLSAAKEYNTASYLDGTGPDYKINDLLEADNNFVPGKSRALYKSLEEMGVRVDGYPGGGTSDYFTIKVLDKNNPLDEFGDQNFNEFKIRVADHGNTTNKYNQPDLNVSPENYTLNEAIDKLYNLVKSNQVEMDEASRMAKRKFSGGKSMSLPTDDLPMDEASRMARAVNDDFNIKRNYFHLTPKNIDKFQLGSDPTSHTGGGAIWLRESPDSMRSAHQTGTFGNLKEGTNDMPLVVRENKELPSSVVSELRQRGDLSDHFPLRISMKESELLKSLGYTHYNQSGEVAVFNTKDIRSRFAKFDPKKRDSSDLLAAGLPLSAFVGEKDDTPYDRLKRKFKGAK